jgi:autotransporter-associated beta strand protein
MPAALAALSAALASTDALAVNGTWSPTGFAGNGTGSWSSATNWASGVVADGASSIASFNTLNLTADSIVSLDSARTIGQLLFSDTTQSNLWTLDNGGNPANILTLDNGASQPIITVNPNNNTFNTRNTTISAVINSNNGFVKTGGGALVLSAANNITGQVVINSTSSNPGADLYLAHNNALGSATLFIDPGASFNSRTLVDAGVVIPNNVIINTSRATAGSNSSLMTAGNVAGAGFSGAITIHARAASGGHISGPDDDSITNFLTFSGPITLSPTYSSIPANLTNSAGNGLLIRSGNVIFSGGGSYFRAEVRSGELRVGAVNGVATNAYLDLAGNANNNPMLIGRLNLNGFNQTLVGLQNAINNGTPAEVTNGSTTSAATLTLTPVDPTATPSQANLVLTAGGTGMGGNARLLDTDPNFPLNLVINGAANGVQTLNTPQSAYRGFTQLTSGILSVNSIADGDNPSSIGASSSAASNLVFDGGTLRYTGSGAGSNRNFTITVGKTGTIDVTNANATLNFGGGGVGGGGLIKTGPGTLQFAGSSASIYSGPTSVNGGALTVDGTLASNVTIASGARLAGQGTISGTVTPASGGIISPGTSIGTLTVASLTLGTGSQINFEFGGGNNDRIAVTSAGGLTANGGNFFLFNDGNTSAFATNGTYSLFNINGGIGGSLNNLTISNPVAGKFYTLANAGSTIDLTIGDAVTIEWNNSAANGLWSTGGNWVGGTFPNGVGQTARFAGLAPGGNVDLNGNKTVSGLIFDNGSSYTLSGAASVLTIDNGSAAGAITVSNGSHEISVPVTLAGAVAVELSNGANLTLNGDLSGAQAMSVSGQGNLNLRGTNGFTTLAVSGSRINVGTEGGSDTTGSLGTGPVTLSNNATLNFNRSNTYNFGQNITGAGTVQHLGTGTTAVGAVSVNHVRISNGALTATSIAQSEGVVVEGGGRLTTGAISGAGSLSVNTSGSVSLTGANTYTGGTQIDNGTVTLNAAGTLPTNSALTVNNGTLDLNAKSISVGTIAGGGGVITNHGASGSVSTISINGNHAQLETNTALNDGANGGKIALVSFIENTTSSQNGNDNQYRLTLRASSTYSGGTTVTKQSIFAAATNALGTGSVVINANNTSTNNSRLYITGNVQLPNDIVVAQPNAYLGFGAIHYDTASAGNATLTGSITQQANPFSGGLIVGPPTTTTDFLYLKGPILATGTATEISLRGGNIALASTGSSYANLLIFGRTRIDVAGAIPSTALVNMQQGGILDLNGFNQTTAGLISDTGPTVNVVTNSSATPAVLTLNTAANGTFTGQIDGPLGIVKGGTATQALLGVASWTGSTTVNSGTLIADRLGSGPLTINAGSRATITAKGTPNDPTGTTVVPSLTINSGVLDLTNNSMVIDYTGAVGTQVGDIRQHLAAGRITSSVATTLVGVGYADNAVLSPVKDSFGGVSVDASSILIKHTYFGDVNLDGQVDVGDLGVLATNWQTIQPWSGGDFDYNGSVDVNDLGLLATNWQAGVGTPLGPSFGEAAAALGLPSSAVPEPTTLALLGFALPWSLKRPRRSRR